MTRDIADRDIEAALADPSAFFAQPQDIVTHPRLSREVKLKLLRQWEQDARELSVAEGEGMGGGEESMLGRVHLALRKVEGAAGA
ncbi:hypothetical protein [Limobrevibacterium gyesilva]|uniref:Uncharacterized protein n=1 Tax=Limobrevibacterium gyesilva TaxID=2991712 RepID=A0AA41YS62_9PROT|nr:hypothetical protein [Limobrevibacterium gyesilva]MCW3477870.1 hypothetical protein [Limobrevibacterium gyesilva]